MGTLKEHLRLPISQKWEGEAGKEGDDVTQPFFENEAVFFFFAENLFDAPTSHVFTTCKSKVTVGTWPKSDMAALS